MFLRRLVLLSIAVALGAAFPAFAEAPAPGELTVKAKVEKTRKGEKGRKPARTEKPQAAAEESFLPGFSFTSLFKPRQEPLSAGTRLRDEDMKSRKTAKKPVMIDPKYEPQSVAFSGYKKGMIVDTQNKFLYLIESRSSARRYGIAVGRDGLEFKGSATIAEKQEWPRWIPTKEMIKRDPKQYEKYADGMDGGPENPLGARALYLYKGKQDTHIRIHGTTQPWTIGTAASNGCFRMVNEHVMDLYTRVKVGAEVVVM